MTEKKTKEERLLDFERKGNHWLELLRNWIIEANQAPLEINNSRRKCSFKPKFLTGQAENLALQEDFSSLKNLLKKIGSNRRNKKVVFVAERRKHLIPLFNK